MQPSIDPSKLNQHLERMLADIGAAMSASLVVIGDKLGLYKALAEGGPLSPAELAQKTGTQERYVREWLNAQAASGYVGYHAASETYELSPEQAFVLAEQDLSQRGEGHILGDRQHGLPDLRFASLVADLDLVDAARQDAFSIVSTPRPVRRCGRARCSRKTSSRTSNGASARRRSWSMTWRST